MTTAAIYVDAAGYARYYENAGDPLPREQADGLTRLPLPAHVREVFPCDITAAENAHRATLRDPSC